jgi:hypothetical protein
VDVVPTLTLDLPILVTGKRVGSGACIGLGEAPTLLASACVIVHNSEALNLYCSGPVDWRHSPCMIHEAYAMQNYPTFTF